MLEKTERLGHLKGVFAWKHALTYIHRSRPFLFFDTWHELRGAASSMRARDEGQEEVPFSFFFFNFLSFHARVGY